MLARALALTALFLVALQLLYRGGGDVAVLVLATSGDVGEPTVRYAGFLAAGWVLAAVLLFVAAPTLTRLLVPRGNDADRGAPLASALVCAGLAMLLGGAVAWIAWQIAYAPHLAQVGMPGMFHAAGPGLSKPLVGLLAALTPRLLE